ncbi:hypothetical protein SH449x_003872 [Pirellulaceae bacterium SH449]
MATAIDHFEKCVSDKRPESGDYRFAWQAFSYSLVIAAMVGAKSLVVWLAFTKTQRA